MSLIDVYPFFKTQTISNSQQIRHHCSLTILWNFWQSQYELMLSRAGLSTNTWTLYKQQVPPFPLFFHHWASRPKNEEDASLPPANQICNFSSLCVCVRWWVALEIELKIWQTSHRATLWKIYIGTTLFWCMFVPACNICMGTIFADIIWEILWT